VAAGLKTVGDVRKTSDATLLSIQNLGPGSLTRLRNELGHGVSRKLKKLSGLSPAQKAREMKTAFSRIFTLEVDRRPTLAFEASGTKEAQQICQESWLLNDLSTLTSSGVRLRTAKSRLSVRLASPDEATVFALVANKTNTSEGMVLAYLVDLDGKEDRP
jgi:hypothetical protein